MRLPWLLSPLAWLALTACAARAPAPAAPPPVVAEVPAAPVQARLEVAAQEAVTVERPTVAPVALPPAPPAPTWSTLYARYFGPGTPGACGRAAACHASVVSDADSAYEWLSRRGYISGTTSSLVSKTNSCLHWFGGNMPPRAAGNDQAAQDLLAWVAAGARQD